MASEVTMRLRTAWFGGLAAAAALAAGGLSVPAAADAGDNPYAHCGRQDRINVPGAEHQAVSCLDDLTTAGTVASGHTVPGDWAGLQSAQTVNPSGVAGIQVDGYFPDTSTTNANHGWNHDAQFVIRFPDDWNGKLVVTGAPGNRRQYALDATISDWVLARGYAFAATDKGNTGTAFYRDGTEPGDAVAEWNARVTELTIAAQQTVRQRYGRPMKRTYITGLSNGGYLTRWQLENHPELYDGGVDWEGTLFRADGPNLLTFLPPALRHYPAYRAGSEAAHEAMLAAGFPAGSEVLWDYHYAVYWDLTQRIYREEFDPSYDGATEAGTPFCASGTPGCDADYDYFARPQAVRDAVAKVQLTGRIGKPLLTLHGTLDALLPPAVDSDLYTELIQQARRGRLHRYFLIEDGNHVDGLYDLFPTKLRPILPCYRDAFATLEQWVEEGQRPPASGPVPHPASGGVVNRCSIADRG
jgi:hypothetical protein